MTRVSHVLFAGSFVYLLGLQAWAAPQIAMVPVSASGPHAIVGNQITLTGGGQRVFFDVRVSGWTPQRLLAFQAAVNSAGYASGSLGVLAPANVPCASDATCTAAFGNGARCDDPPGAGVRCTAGFQDSARADWVYAGVASLFTVDIGTPDYRYAGTVLSPASAPVDPGSPRYAGALVLDVPAGAYGTFTIQFAPDPDSNLYDVNNLAISGLTLTPGIVRVNCTSNVVCNDNNACTNDTCQGNGTCANTNNYDPIVSCCRPSDRTLTPINDNNACTTDLCDPITGVVTHPPRPDGTTCGSPTNTECNRPDSCLSGVCNANLQPAGTPCGSQTSTDCNAPDTCNGSGTCLSNFAPSGTACGDPADTDCTNPDTCNASGQCLTNHAANGQACNDGLCCNVGETCTSGVCGGGAPRNCSDGLSCTSDVCDEGASPNCCVSTLNAGFCLIGGICRAAGTLDPLNQCRDCNPALSTTDWSFRLAGSACNDANECTGGDACDGQGVCAATPEPDGTPCTDDGNECTFDLCLAAVCDHPFRPAATACGDPADRECDDPDTCDGAGSCDPNNESDGVVCGNPASDQCDNPDSCNGLGVCDPRFQPTGFPCDDGDIRTGNDACDQGVCAGTPLAEAPIVTANQPRALLVTPQPPGDIPVIALRITSPDYPCLDRYISTTGTLVTTPVFQTPDQWGTVLVRGPNIVPNTRYAVVADDGGFISDPGTARTSLWGDVAGAFVSGQWSNPNGSVQILDAVAILERFRNVPSAPAIYRVDLVGQDQFGITCQPDSRVNIIDVVVDLDAFRGLSYTQVTQCPLPCVLEEE